MHVYLESPITGPTPHFARQDGTRPTAASLPRNGRCLERTHGRFAVDCRWMGYLKIQIGDAADVLNAL